MTRRLGAALSLLGASLTAATDSFAQGGPTPAPGATPARNTLPLKTARTDTFTTSKGTWISLDVVARRPDDRLRPARRSLHDADHRRHGDRAHAAAWRFDAQPRFSPDGKKIVFVSDRGGGDNLWIMSLDKKDTVQLTTANDNLYVVAGVDARRQVHRRVEVAAASAARRSSGCITSDGGTGRGAACPAAPPTAQAASAPPFGKDRPLHLVRARARATGSTTPIGPQYQLVVYDRETGKHVADVDAQRLGVPAGAVARRQVARLRLRASRRRPASASATSRRSRRTGSPIRCSATNRNRALRSTCYPGYAFTPDSRRSSSPTAARSGACRSTRAHRRRFLLGRCEARDGTRGEVRVSRRHARHFTRAPDPRHRAVARRQASSRSRRSTACT